MFVVGVTWPLWFPCRPEQSSPKVHTSCLSLHCLHRAVFLRTPRGSSSSLTATMTRSVCHVWKSQRLIGSWNSEIKITVEQSKMESMSYLLKAHQIYSKLNDNTLHKIQIKALGCINNKWNHFWKILIGDINGDKSSNILVMCK